jgi:hypothetical protein
LWSHLDYMYRRKALRVYRRRLSISYKWPCLCYHRPMRGLVTTIPLLPFIVVCPSSHRSFRLIGWITMFSGGSTSSAFGICIAPLTATQQMVSKLISSQTQTIYLYDIDETLNQCLTDAHSLALSHAYVMYRYLKRHPC